MVDPNAVLALPVGVLRSEVFRRLGLAAPKRDYGNGLFGKLARQLLGDETDLDRGPGYVDIGVVRAFPSLNLRSSIGVEMFFDKNYRLKSVWYERPFPLPVWGLSFGDSPQSVRAKRGEPTRFAGPDQDHPSYFLYELPDEQAIKTEFSSGGLSVVAYGWRSEV